MITPRTTRLVRVPDLHAMHAVIADLVSTFDPVHGRPVVLVPTRSAAESVRRTLESLILRERGRAVCVPPDLLTRTELYARLHEAVGGYPAVLTEFEREVLFRRAARVASEGGAPAPFRIRAGLVVQMLAFYDELRRRDRSVGDFERLMTDSLAGSVEIDSGAERMMRQTRFLTAAFAEFERAVAASGSLDEHSLRARLLESGTPAGIRHIVLTVADQTADARGLWTVDYDLLARIAGLERLDVVATENLLASGFHERIHDLLPGIEEERRHPPLSSPVLLVPAGDRDTPGAYWFTSRDREEELADVAARVKTRATSGRVAVVFQRPLPYLYLAKNVFADAGVPWHAVDALPLAAEPFAAAVDLIFAALLSEANRASLIELLASPHWRFARPDGTYVAREEIGALDRILQRAKYFGGWAQLADLAAAQTDRAYVAPVLDVSVSVARRLQTLAGAPAASAQFEALLDFIRVHERIPSESESWYARHVRARAAILNAIEALAAAHRTHDDSPLEPGELSNIVRRWIEGQTFSPRTGSGGVALLDASAAAYADADDVRFLGLVESDWPERSARNIFYPASLLSQLGWPAEGDRLAAARSRFRDLLALPRVRLSLSAFTLEDDAIVSPSPLLDEVAAMGLAIERCEQMPRPRVFVHEALAGTPVLPAAVEGDAAAWLALRLSRQEDNLERFRGQAGPRRIGAVAVSHIERYLDCPFKYFAQYVLRLEEEKKDQSGLTPQERGQLLHAVFEEFFRRWHDDGRGAITGANLAEALARFETIAEERLAKLDEADRSLERTYLLGSAVAPGLAGRAFAFEIEHGVGVVERLLEYALEGTFLFEAKGQARRVTVRAKVDRIDLLEDGTLRVIDYKLGRAPKPARALQLPVYGVCASQHLDGRHGRDWTLSRAGYVAFREPNAFVSLARGSQPEALAAALEDGQHRFLTALSGIERGEFPVDPDEPFLCTRCGYAGVCRKDYVGDE